MSCGGGVRRRDRTCIGVCNAALSSEESCNEQVEHQAGMGLFVKIRS